MPASFPNNILRRFHQACANYHLLEDGDHVLIGLSGGKDSLALTELLGQRSKIYKPRFRVTALHVRVKERAYQTDLTYLESFCREAGVPLLVRDVEIGESPITNNQSPITNPKSPITNHQSPITNNQSPITNPKSPNPCFLCAWYRRKTLFNVAQEIGCNKIAFGHHRDDVLETMLMNLIYQGAFATMPPKLALDKMPIAIIRPLCLIDEQDIIRLAEQRQYAKQPKLCPFEHVSSRAKVKELLAQIKALNPEASDSMFAALTNIKTDYLPEK